MLERLLKFVLPAAVLLEPLPALAYLDPGTGSMLLSVVVGVVSSAYFFARRLPEMTRALFFRMAGKKDAMQATGIVFYSERASYWSTFAPVLRALDAMGEPVTFLTSDEADPAFSCGLENVHARYVGKGQSAYTALGFVKAEVFALTTPGIDVLQIRRSAGVKKYVHIVHAVGDIHTYKLFSFDYYDAFFCAGPDQAESLRALEASRGTRPKDLPVLGCPYLDELVSRQKVDARGPEPQTVLVAPTWGKNSLLSRLGARAVLELEEAGLRVILRPHPQSFVSDETVMKEVLEAIEGHPGIELDRRPDGFESMRRACVMVSDISGIMFDFAFVFLRPVVSLGDGPLKDGFEAWEIPHPSWEEGILDAIGKRIPVGDEASLVATVRELLEGRGAAGSDIERIRNAHVANFGEAGPAIARALVAQKREVKKDA